MAIKSYLEAGGYNGTTSPRITTLTIKAFRITIKNVTLRTMTLSRVSLMLRVTNKPSMV